LIERPLGPTTPSECHSGSSSSLIRCNISSAVAEDVLDKQYIFLIMT